MKKYNEFLNDNNPQVKITTQDDKEMLLELFPECAPVTVENFLNLVENHFYDNLIFHRVIKDFMIQGGDPLGNGMGGSDKPIKGEFRSNGVKNDLCHSRGVISMARTNDPNSASSQFFICHTDVSHLDGQYAAFGVLLEGFETLDHIANMETDFMDKPLKQARIKSIVRVR